MKMGPYESPFGADRVLRGAGVVTLFAIVGLALAYRVVRHAHSSTGPSQDRPSHATVERTVMHVMVGIITMFVRLGVPLGPMMLLTVPGRRSGLPRTNPVDVFERDGKYWLVATHSAEAQWVHNLRAAGTGTLTRGRRRLTFTAAELPPAEATEVLSKIIGPRLSKPLGGLVLRRTLGLHAGASRTEFASVASEHPVFEFTMTSPASNRRLIDEA